jgi:polysaccharide transporter, PST family
MIRNFFHLSLLRGINMLSPLVLFPYLIRTIGLAHFGDLTTAFAVTSYLVVIGDYGFQQSAIRQTASQVDNRELISELYWTTTLTKPVLLIATALICFLVTLLYSGNSFLSLVWFSGIFIALGESTLPIWFFQGIEKMQNLVYANLISRLVGLALVVIFVDAEAQFYLTLPMLGVGALLASLFSHLVLLPRFGLVQPFKQRYIKIVKQLKIGYPFFVRSFAFSIYAFVPVFMLTYTAPAASVGHFGVADRIVAMIKAMLAVFSTAIFPQLVKLKPEGHQAIIQHLNRYFKPYIAGVVIGSALLFVFAKEIIFVFTGEPNLEVVPILRAMAFLPVSLALAQPMDALMQVYGREQLLSRLIIAVGILNIGLNLLLVPKTLAFGTALSLFLTETAIVFLFFWYFERKFRNEAYFFHKA